MYSKIPEGFGTPQLFLLLQITKEQEDAEQRETFSDLNTQVFGEYKAAQVIWYGFDVFAKSAFNRKQAKEDDGFIIFQEIPFSQR